MPRRSTNDKRGKHPYMIGALFLKIVERRLKSPYLSDDYRARLEVLKAECEYEKSKKQDMTIWKMPK